MTHTAVGYDSSLGRGARRPVASAYAVPTRRRLPRERRVVAPMIIAGLVTALVIVAITFALTSLGGLPTSSSSSRSQSGYVTVTGTIPAAG
ncbi:MAG: hypothetical protein LKI25_02415 [Atopobiaceae bacterium]|nr:hypothetical protein [Atopobiaceae bacterium]MCI2173061.1 hypothetical protein [Atopobiaceae bacterium]MCI2208154.1 hypothetical protein [Atopobiaceae bacterium]